MSNLPVRMILALCVGILFWPTAELHARPPQTPGTPSVTIDVPRLDSSQATRTPIGVVTATVSFASEAPVVLSISDPGGSTGWQVALPGALPGGSGGVNVCSGASLPSNDPDLPTGGIGCQFPTPPAVQNCLTACRDKVTITTDSTSLPGSSRYQIIFRLYSNFNSNSMCAETESAPPSQDAYTITVTSGPNITGVCLETYDVVVAVCSTQNVASISVASGAFVAGQPLPTEKCFKERPGLDVMMVLDKSGSMSSPPLGTRTCGTTPVSKIVALQQAVSDFANVWNGLRVGELPTSQTDEIGADLFSSAANPWTPGTMAAGLNQFAAANPAGPSFPVPDITSNVGTITPGGSTSIGGGLFLAANQLPATQIGRREVILLMSDGKQNTGRGAGTDPLTNRTSTYSDVNLPPCPVANPASNPCTDLTVPVYTVTVGTQTAVDPAIMQNIATHSGSFYINSEDNACLLRPFFLELLQNFLKFNSYETLRMISATAPYTGSMPIATTSRDVEFNLMWQPEFGRLRLTVTPPGGAPPIVKENSSGFVSIFQSLPIPPPFDPLRDWTIKVEALGTIDTTRIQGNVPFDLHVMADDGAIKSDLSVVPQDYKSDGKILLRAKLTQFGRPILGLGSRSNDTIAADPVEPGQSIGDMLSDSKASPNPPPAYPDLQIGADAKLFNTLQNDPSKLIRRKALQIMLFDDGKPEHGDDVAGDGIYSALYSAPLPGHYNFLIAAESVDPTSVRFSRQQLRTAYVRAMPDAGNTQLQSTIIGRGRERKLSIVMIPRGKAGDRLGPGWANYFWFTSPGATSFKAVDKLNGSYTATLAFNGPEPPPVTVHFEDVVALIGDSVTSDKLPQPLDSRNVLTIVPPPNQLAGKIAVFVDAGAGVPHGTFGNAFNTGFSLNAGLEYIATSQFSVEGIFGFHDFSAKVGSSSLDVYQVSANGKYYLTSGGPLRPFVNGGIGGYKFSPGATYFGGNFGGGILYELGPHWGLQASYNFHAVNTPGAATKFSTAQGGIRFVF